MDSKKTLFIQLILLTAVLIACKKDPEDEEFDRKAMLTDMASAVIQPSYNDFSAKLQELDASSTTFSSNPTTATLDDLRTKYVAAYSSFQHCKMFDFGPMMDYGIKTSVNTYPTDTAKINSNISSGTYNLNLAENIAAIGFPAIDYILYPNHATSTIAIDSFTTSSNSANRLAYLNEITAKMKADFDNVTSNWSGYSTSFVNTDGNDVGSSTSLLFNEFVKDIELLKNAKIGIPAGQQTGGQPLPTYTEGHYAQISISLALENTAGLKNAFLGAAGIGFDDYIKDVESDDVSTSLADNISAQFDVVTSKLNEIGTPLSGSVDSNPTVVNNAFLEIKKLVTYCKTDMSSTLGLLITFQDNDGD